MRNSFENKKPVFIQNAEKSLDSFFRSEINSAEDGGMPQILYRVEKGEVQKGEMQLIMLAKLELDYFFPVKDGKTLETKELKEILKYIEVDYKDWQSKVENFNDPQYGDSASNNAVRKIKEMTKDDQIRTAVFLTYYNNRMFLEGDGDAYKILSGCEKVFGKKSASLSAHLNPEKFEKEAKKSQEKMLSLLKNATDTGTMQSSLADSRVIIDDFWYHLMHQLKI